MSRDCLRGRRTIRDSICGVSNPNRSNRSRIGRPVRRLRRWARHTPNGTMALNMMSAGVALIFIAVILAIFVF